MRRDDRAEPVTGKDDPFARLVEQARTLGDRHDVVGSSSEVVGAVLGRGIGQAVAAEVHRHDREPAAWAAEPSRDRRPDPGGLAQPVDHDGPGRPRASGGPPQSRKWIRSPLELPTR